MLSTMVKATVRDMTTLVVYNCNQLSQYLKQALEKGSDKKWKLGNSK